MQLQKGKTFAVEVKDVTEKGDIAGYGSVFNNVDGGYDVVEPGAFANSLKERGLPKMLWGHDFWDPPIGKWNQAKEDDHGLYLEGKLLLDTQRGKEVHAGLKAKTLDGLSIGYTIDDAEVSEAGIRHLKEIDLWEVSVVTFPMNELARVDAVKQLVEGGLTKRQLETILRDAGFTRGQAKALVADGYDGLIDARDALVGSAEDWDGVKHAAQGIFR